MTQAEELVHEAARLIAAAMARRMAAGLSALPPWRDGVRRRKAARERRAA